MSESRVASLIVLVMSWSSASASGHHDVVKRALAENANPQLPSSDVFRNQAHVLLLQKVTRKRLERLPDQTTTQREQRSEGVKEMDESRVVEHE